MELRPFRSIRFASSVVRRSGLAAVIAPVHDPVRRDSAIPTTPAPGNIARITLPFGGDEEERRGAAETLRKWLAGEVLEKERRPGMWGYRQTFQAEGRTRVRDLLIGLVRLVEPAPGILLPDGETSDQARDDRLALLSATRADFEPVLLLTRAPLSRMLSTRRRPTFSFSDSSGVRHDALRIEDFAAHVEFQGLVKNAETVLAEGRHLYEAALAFSRAPEAAKLSGAKYKLSAIQEASGEEMVRARQRDASASGPSPPPVPAGLFGFALEDPVY
jgi:uncharacterized protein (DUF1015 family)